MGRLSNYIAFAATMLLFACTSEACLEQTESYLKASLYSYSTKRILAPDSLTVRGPGMDTTFIYNKSRKISLMKLPLRADSETTTFVVTINDISDTVAIRHTSYPHLISRECGYTWYHDIEPPSWSNNAIDSVWLRFDVVTNNDEENIRIYY